MKRTYVTAALVIAAEVVLAAAYYRAVPLGVLAVPFLAGAWVARRRPRAGAIVVGIASLGMLAVTIPQLLTPSGRSVFDLQWDTVCFGAAVVAIRAGIRALSGSRVTAPAAR